MTSFNESSHDSVQGVVVQEIPGVKAIQVRIEVTAVEVEMRASDRLLPSLLEEDAR